ncbi:MAG: filamentous hemagglutinin N-terminal domain-containing protein [Candidatus Gastranaerophilales bacterium]|nr:filamentous hemagglutinin N-terminal domain-containing protein [Candidatus Gastranaerophilales bacterium]
MRKKTSKILAASLIVYSCLGSMAMADIGANVLPSLGSIENGKVTTSGNNMNVSLTGGQGGTTTADWNSFNVGSNAGVNFRFNDHNQTALNLVKASGGMSYIYGQITNDGIGADTGKVLLLNPNGAFFGNGSSVNLNSFTVSSFDGKYDNEMKRLELTKGSNSGNITIDSGATIIGAKGVNMAASNITALKGSMIKTSNIPNSDGQTYGKVRLVTGDGVNFNYYNCGATYNLTDNNVATTTDNSQIILNGAIEGGGIDIRNASTGAASGIFAKGASLKATKAVRGEDGSIFLTANGKIVVEDSTFTTANKDSAAANAGVGKIALLSGTKTSVLSSDFVTTTGNSAYAGVGDVTFGTVNGDTVLQDSTVKAQGNVVVEASGTASIQKGNNNGTNLNGTNVTISGGEAAQVLDSTINAEKAIKIKNPSTPDGDYGVWMRSATLKGQSIDINAKGNVIADKMTAISDTFTAYSKNNIDISNNSKATIKNDVNITADKAIKIADSNITSTKGNVGITSETALKTDNATIKAANTAQLMAKSTNGGTTDIIGSAIDGSYVSVSGQNATVKNSTITATDSAFIAGGKYSSTSNNILVDKNSTLAVNNSTIKSNNNTSLTGGSIAINNNSKVSGNNVNVTAVNDINTSDITNSTLTANNNVNIKSAAASIKMNTLDNLIAGNRTTFTAAKNVELTKSGNFNVNKIDITAGETAAITSTNSSVQFNDTAISAKTLKVKAAQDITTPKTLDIKGIQANFDAGHDVNVTLTNADNRQLGVVAKGGNDVTLKTAGTLSVSSAIAKNDLTIDSKAVIAGLPYTSEGPVDEQGNPRSYMEAGGTFTSTADYELTGSFVPTEDGKFNQRHHIEYGNAGEEKILLVNNRPVPKPADPDPDPDPAYQENPTIDSTALNEAQQLNKLPLQAEQASKLAPIADNRTNLLDVFAAASQIEIVDDEDNQKK